MNKDFEKMVLLLKQDDILNDFVNAQEINGRLKIFYSEKIITFCRGGFGSLLTWWCDGSITSADSKHLNDVTRYFNDSVVK